MTIIGREIIYLQKVPQLGWHVLVITYCIHNMVEILLHYNAHC